MKKSQQLRVGVLFGGRSGEHEVSLLSAASILSAIDTKKYAVVPIGITREGRWLTGSAAQSLLTDGGDAAKPQLLPPAEAAAPPFNPLDLTTSSAAGAKSLALDVVFPVLHGTFGEDGTVQGLFELADVAYVGSGVLGSAAGMDKVVMKQLFAAAGLPQTPYLGCLRRDWFDDPRGITRRIEKHLAYPVFVKPANLGSSVGISKVHDRSELAGAMNLAASFDRKLILEQGVGGPGVKPRELEVAVLGNDTPEASVVGEIVPGAEFYDYNAKYHSDQSVPIIPAELTAAQSKEIRAMALAAFRACDGAGLARVDFLMEPERTENKSERRAGGRRAKPRIYLNEINTLPGFTSISMYPKLWGATGLDYKTLIDRLITLALDRHAERKQTTFAR